MSSIAVVAIYLVVSVFYDFSSPILTYIAAVVLVILGDKNAYGKGSFRLG